MKAKRFLIILYAACLFANASCQNRTESLAQPSGVWEGAQEAGDIDWSMTLDFNACTGNTPCAKVYYVVCAGEFEFKKEENGGLFFQENITENPDNCFSGATVRVDYQRQDQPMIVSWLGEGDEVFTSAEMHYQDPNAKIVFDGLGDQIASYHFAPGGYSNFGSLTANDGSIWIPDSGHGKVIRFDIASNQVIAEIQVGSPDGSSFGDPQMIAISGDSIWVTQCAEKKLARIDPNSNQIVDTIQLEVEPYAIAVDDTTIWVTSFEPNQVLRVDTLTKEVVAINDIDKPLGIAVGGGAVWVAEHRTGNLVRIDSEDTTAVERIQLPNGSTPENVVYAEGSVWVANNFGNSISQVDPQTNSQTVISLPGRATNVSFGGGFIWVSMYPPQDAEVDLSKYQLAKIDPASKQIIQVFDFAGASGTAYLDGNLWIEKRNDMFGDIVYGIKLTQ